MKETPGTDERLQDVRGEIALVWYKDLAVFILAVFSYLVSNYILYDLGITDNPSGFSVLLIGILSILWFFGIIGIVFLGPISLVSLPTQIRFLTVKKIVITGTAMNLVYFRGQISFSLPFSKISGIWYWDSDAENLRYGHPSSGTNPPDIIVLRLQGGGKLRIFSSFICESDREKFVNLLPSVI